jgi:hypothetical protein
VLNKLIVFLMPTTVIAPEWCFEYQAGETIMTGLAIPQPASEILGIRESVPVKAMHHKTSDTYGFTWQGVRYRAMDGLPGTPAVIVAHIKSEHWQACKPCRDGVWCNVGLGIILDAHEQPGQGGAS